ncbi:hypothetical protein G352_02379 [Rhodococcus ruber BKS 20-38]|uniref:Uncharacterized protein n=1 Tax=Rhodococcus ruber BKS 20-38 TaxID=1278076 RepID=M2Y0R1_9NOCA|nr:hypothetical protein G352_02379 [Rhodococcus ruber BKS 20-38]
MTDNCDLATVAEAESLHTTLMVLLQSNFAAVTTTSEWIAAVRSGAALPESNLVESALRGRFAATAPPTPNIVN